MKQDEYYSKLKGLWDELDNYLELPACTCGVVVQATIQREEEKIFQFLMGLNSDYSTVHSNIITMEPLPSLSRIYSIIIHYERQRVVSQATEAGAVAFAARGNNNHMNYPDRPSCNFCGRDGHFQSTCWALHGYPNWADHQNKDSSQPKINHGPSARFLPQTSPGGGAGNSAGSFNWRRQQAGPQNGPRQTQRGPRQSQQAQGPFSSSPRCQQNREPIRRLLDSWIV